MFRRLPFIVLPLLLAACGANNSAPQLIGAAPKVTSIPPPPNSIVVYDSNLTLEVYDVATAADRAAQIAYDYGGYLSSSQTWQVGNQLYAALTLSVPIAQFDNARDAVLRLGTLVNETLTGDRRFTNYDTQWSTYTTLTVNLRPVSTVHVWPVSRGWNPLDTLVRAFRVFASIFTFVVDAGIWIVVVIGPFVLMGLGLRSLFRRARPKA